MSLLFLIFSQLPFYFFQVILIFVFLAHVFNDCYAFIIEKVVNLIAQLFRSFMIDLDLL